MNISLFIAMRYWRSKSADRFGRLVGFLASIGIVLGVMALIIVLSVMNGLEQHQKKQVLSNIPHAIITPTKGQIDLQQQSPQLADFINKVVPINTTNVILQTSRGINAGQVIGISDFSDDDLLSAFSADSFDNILPKGEYKLIIGELLANKLQVTKGDKIRVIITENSQYTPFGRVPVQRLFTISGIYPSFSDVSNYEIFANLADIGRLMRIKPNEAQGYRLFLEDPFQVTDLENSSSLKDWKISDWRTQKGEFFQAVKMEKNMMGLLVSLIIIVAVSNIITSLSLMVVDKQGEIAILQTQGLMKSQVRNIFIFQGFLVGIMGTLLGSILGVIITSYLDQIIRWFNPQGVYLPTEINYSQILMIILISLVFSLLSTIYPAYRASKIDPAAALRYE
ncbi:lipoprotein-releasing system permease protein [Bisgaardia hudsonensis]|uniref:Lipoprotein-releasing system permease protein n=1 Tax=Bisgaardia hudsonensis TaxID=109472 RepID=A0A4R2N0W2_9PAST|nr:lipoprotein-releasing ABC transporter permease subunit [Bisgaardia hudsonensis]QLB13242.1 permease [Bisgaardia hudsonensis]TCP13177.1 lipoprotein-releasing system permease protein [Bisgaardia hudsonensis]